MDLVERAGTLKGRLVKFALSPRFERQLAEAFEEADPDGALGDDLDPIMVIDHFILQRRLAGGDTVVDRFVRTQAKLTSQERELLLGWKDVVEGIFEVRGKDGDELSLVNLVDELPYRARSTMGKAAFRTLRRGMFVVCRLVPLGEGWLVSGNLRVFPAKDRGVMLTQAMELGLHNPAWVFRNPEKLAAARRMLAEQRAVFVEVFGDELIVVAGAELAERIAVFWDAMTAEPGGSADGAAPQGEIALPDEIVEAESVALHFDPETGLSYYVDFGLLQELFADPALLARRRYRETLSSYLREDGVSPTPIRMLAERDPGNAGVVFRKLLKRRDFSWERDGEALLREYKARYFDAPQLPTHIPVSEEMAEHVRRSRQERLPEGH
ncbi:MULTISPECIES: hypothetical protein [unclassified Nonomuraea]|uniref:hypothetical protein n=1 Tax=unclassified Nonomuraea TaxID=2593643 RepID=UPI0033C30DFB